MKEKNIDEYLMEIGREPLLTADEERALLKAVQEKGLDCEEMKRLEKTEARFVLSLSRQYMNKGLTIWELIDIGTEGLRKAAMKYDFNADVKFLSYAVWWMRQAILQAIAEHDKIEKKRLFYENIAREDDPTAEAVVVMGSVDYDKCPVINEYQAKGYHLSDANAFGLGDEMTGEVLIFSKS